MGVNKQKSLMKFMAEKAGPESQRLTNYGARNRMIKEYVDIWAKRYSGHK